MTGWRFFIKMAVAGILIGTASFTWAENPKPNIVFIMADDHCKQAISSYGSVLIKTPHIDRLAKEGCRFDQLFSNNAICGPARASLLTGLYSHNNGFRANSDVFNGKQNTFPKELQKLGYETAIFGKWHLSSLPTGFSQYAVMKGHGRFYDCPLKRGGTNMPPREEQKTNEPRKKKGAKGRKTQAGRKDRGSVVEGYLTDVITDESIAWLKNRKSSDKPFMMMVHHKAPHGPHDPAPRHKTLFNDTVFPEPETLYDDYSGRISEKIRNSLQSNRLVITRYPQYQDLVKKDIPEKEKLKEMYQTYLKGYLRLVTSLDENIGRLLDYLDTSGLAENTIVIYTSDNGFFLGEHGYMNKMFMYEPAMQLPFIVRYPGYLKPGTTNNTVFNWVDLAPSLVELAGGAAPEEMDGVSYASLLKGKEAEGRKETFYRYYDQKFAPAHHGLRTDRYKIVHFTAFKKSENFSPMWELYDLKNDPNELTNLVNNHEFSLVVQDMKDRLNQYMLRSAIAAMPEKGEKLAPGLTTGDSKKTKKNEKRK